MMGEGWVDRQWGDFAHTKSWDWCSFRFDDGDRVNTYSFYNGYQVGVLQHPDGSYEYFDRFTVKSYDYRYSPKNHTQISCGWDYVLPVKEGRFQIEPLSKDTISEGKGNTFFEGLCRIVNPDGKRVEWTVSESMSTEIMKNGPGAQ